MKGLWLNFVLPGKLRGGQSLDWTALSHRPFFLLEAVRQIRRQVWDPWLVLDLSVFQGCSKFCRLWQSRYRLPFTVEVCESSGAWFGDRPSPEDAHS